MVTLGNFFSFMGIRYPEINNKREREGKILTDLHET